jgi:hypothetical protein
VHALAKQPQNQLYNKLYSSDQPIVCHVYHKAIGLGLSTCVAWLGCYGNLILKNHVIHLSAKSESVVGKTDFDLAKIDHGLSSLQWRPDLAQRLVHWS